MWTSEIGLGLNVGGWWEVIIVVSIFGGTCIEESPRFAMHDVHLVMVGLGAMAWVIPSINVRLQARWAHPRANAHRMCHIE